MGTHVPFGPSSLQEPGRALPPSRLCPAAPPRARVTPQRSDSPPLPTPPARRRPRTAGFILPHSCAARNMFKSDSRSEMEAKTAQLMKSLGSCVLYAASSIALSLVNKVSRRSRRHLPPQLTHAPAQAVLSSYNFKFPFVLLTCQLVCAFLICRICKVGASWVAAPPPPARARGPDAGAHRAWAHSPPPGLTAA